MRKWVPRREEGNWIVRTYVVGRTGEKIKFRIPENIRFNREKMRREVARQERKMTTGNRGIARVVNASFYRSDGSLVRLSYDDGSYEALFGQLEATCGSDQDCRDSVREAADHQMDLLLRRARRACQAAGIAFRYWAITSDVDSDGLPCRVHHHLIVSPAAAEIVRSKWRFGSVHDKILDDEPDHNDLVAYLLRQVRAGRDQKRYTPSRNLIHPQPKDRAVHSDAELSVPRGCSLITRDEFSRGGPQYIRYTLPVGMADESDGDAPARTPESSNSARESQSRAHESNSACESKRAFEKKKGKKRNGTPGDAAEMPDGRR